LEQAAVAAHQCTNETDSFVVMLAAYAATIVCTSIMVLKTTLLQQHCASNGYAHVALVVPGATAQPQKVENETNSHPRGCA